MTAHTAPKNATFSGFLAILIWGTTPLLVAMAARIPPLQLTAIGFGIATLFTLLTFVRRLGEIKAAFHMPLRLWLLGIYGIFGFNFFYFLALRHAPVVDAVLIVNLWPLVMTLLSIPSEKRPLEWQHIAGAILGISGVTLAVTKGAWRAPDSTYLFGYGAAFACAFIWASYSILCRREGKAQPVFANLWYCLATAILAAIGHFLLEDTVIPDETDWMVMLFAGMAPMGLVFFLWDRGIKYGDIRLLSTLSYFEPLAGLFFLVAFGYAEMSWLIGIATALIITAAWVSSTARASSV